MPVYNYKCKNCENEFSDIKTISERDDPCKEPCENCGETRIEKKIGPVAFKFGGNEKHSNSFNDKLKDMRKNLPKGKLPLDDAIR